MKLLSADIKNLKSYFPSELVDFKKDVNLFVGPNSGGKSNLFEILQGALNLIIFYKASLAQNEAFRRLDQDTRHKRYKLTEQTPDQTNLLSNIFDCHFKHFDQPSGLRLKFLIESKDIELINELTSSLDLIKEKVSEDLVNADFLVNRIIAVSQISNLSSFVGKEIYFDITPPSNCTLSFSSELSDSDKGSFEHIVAILRSLNIFYEISLKIPEIPGYPIFSYLSPHRFTGQIPQAAYHTLGISVFDTQYSSRYNQNKEDQRSFIEGSALRIAYLHDDGNILVLDKFKRYLNKYLRIQCDVTKDDRDPYSSTYLVQFTRLDGSPLRLSSGEKEFFNLICGLVLTGLKNGVVFLDEPELHLHSQWQQIILDLIYQLSDEDNVQFFIITHSPKLINYRSLPNTFRIWMTEGGISKIINPTSLVQADDIKDIVQFINTTNSEKAFFSQKVILVEGISDLLVYSEILKRIKIQEGKDSEIEFVEVRGKYTLGKIRDFLNSWKIDNYIIGDFDFLKELKKPTDDLIKNTEVKNRLVSLNDEIEAIFTFSERKLREMLCGSPSKDAASVVDLLCSYDPSKKEEFEKKLIGLIAYVRDVRAREVSGIPTPSPELGQVLADLATQEKIMIIKSGSLESMFSSLVTSGDNKVQKALQLIDSPDLLVSAPTYLKDWFRQIL